MGMKDINKDLREYIERDIFPKYNSFDKGHKIDHVKAVISEALLLSSYYDVDINMIYTAAAYHDIGLQYGRTYHNVDSAKIIREDSNLTKWFNYAEINIIAEAAEDHRASLGHEPRSIYGRIIAEADRLIIPDVIVRRAIQYAIINNPDLNKSDHYKIIFKHMINKYGENGYLKLWIPESKNGKALQAFRKLLKEETQFNILFDKIYEEEIKTK